jgi:hypothetical protein
MTPTLDTTAAAVPPLRAVASYPSYAAAEKAVDYCPTSSSRSNTCRRRERLARAAQRAGDAGRVGSASP